MKLPRFQFRLRTLLIVVTVLSATCGYLAHEYRIVQERMEFVKPRRIRRVDYFDDSHLDGISWIRRWLGDRRYLVIAVGDNAPQSTLDEYQSIYPEAVIVRSADDKAFKAIGAD